MPGRQTASRTIGHVPTKGGKAPTHIIPVLAVEPNSIAAVVIRACAGVNGDDVAMRCVPQRETRRGTQDVC